MRRRRNADAPTDVVTDVPSEIASETGAEIAANLATDLSSDSASPAESTPIESPVSDSLAPESAADATADVAEAPVKPAPRRRTSTRRKTATPDEAVVAPVEAVAEPVAAEAAETPAPAVEEPVVAPAPKPRRRRTPVAAAPVEPVAEVPAEAEVTPEPVTAEATEPVAPEAVAEVVEAEAATTAEAALEAPAEPPLRRRGPARRRTAVAPVAEPVVEAASVPEVAEVVTPVAETASDETPAEAEAEGEGEESAETPAEGGRRRGRNRRRRGAAAAAATEGEASPAAETTEAGEPTVVNEVVDGSGERRRLRGVRPVRNAAAATTTGTPVGAIVPLIPAEPLPPQYQPLPEEVLARLPETRVVLEKGVPDLVVNGEPRLPLWFFVNTDEALLGDDPAAREVAQRQIRLAYEAGIRTFTVLAHLPWKMRSGERRTAPLDDALRFIAENAPDALIMPRLIFSPTPAWERAHADQMTLYPNGENGDVSYGSRLFWENEADEALRAAVEHVAQGEFAGRVFGFYLEHGEWLYEKGRGYDTSEANTQSFRTWLRTRYRNSQVALRAAWFDGNVTFETAAVPTLPAAPATPSSSAPIFFGDREQRFVDFHEYSSDVVAGILMRLGKAVKEASGGRSAVAVSYGYTLELSRAYSGHLALGQLLASPNVDILTGPVSYSGRTPGGSAPLPAPIDSVILAGKLWISEDDTKTFLAHGDTPDGYNTKITSFEGTWAAYTRNFGVALTRGAGISWMDLWGMGWLDDRELWQRIARLRSIADVMAARRRNPLTPPVPEPDVAVIVDERSYFDVKADESVLSHLVAHQRDALLRSGARVGFYLLSDLLKKNFPAGPRLLIFLNAFNLPDAVRTAIHDRFQDDGRTLAWVYGPGSCETNLGELTDVIGMQLRLQPWGSKMGTQPLPNARSPLTDPIRGQRIGEEERVNPSYYVVDSRATPLGEYVGNGNTSIAYRKHARWQSVFVGEMTMPIPLLRGLYRLAGVPIYTVDDDVATIGDCLLSLHSAPGGGTIVYLPEEGVLYDLLAEETLATDGQGARLSMPPRGTRLLFWGNADDVARLGGDPKAGPPGLTASELPPPPAPFAFESSGESRSAVADVAFGAGRPADVSAEDDALMRAAMAGEDFGIPAEALADEDAEFAVDASDSAALEGAATTDEERQRKRRRRRRGGRGRSGGESGNADGSGDESGDLTAELPDVSDETAAFTPPPFDLFDDDASLAPVDPDGEVEIGIPAFMSPEPVPVPTVVRVRPTLEELLPHSEVAPETDLPPIPEELLPLDAGVPAEDLGGEPVAPRRRRGRRTTAAAAAPVEVSEGGEGTAEASGGE